MFPVVMDVSNSGVAKAEFNFGNGFFGTTAVASAGTNASGFGNLNMMYQQDILRCVRKD